MTSADDSDELDRACVALHVRMTARAVTRAFDEAMRPSGLKITQYMLLSALRRDDWHSVTELAERLALERTSLTRNLQLLAAEGLIEPGGGGGRATVYHVTGKGEAALAAAKPYWLLAQDRLESGLGLESWTATREGLRSLRKIARAQQAG